MRAATNLSRVSWGHPPNMDYHEWLASGRRLGVIGRGSQWWVGDWLVFGTARFGERYAEASRITGYDPKTLRNLRYVASRFPASLRRDKLEWSHHALLAAFDPEEQAHWLDRAIDDRLSVEDLRCELRVARRSQRGEEDDCEPVSADPAASSSSMVVVCPQCGTRVPIEDSHDEAS